MLAIKAVNLPESHFSTLTLAPTNTNIDVLVCAKQHESNLAGARGYGDIGHALRVIGLLKKTFANRKIALAVEYSGIPSERERIKKIIDINKVDSLLINIAERESFSLRNILQKWITQAECIIHTPSGIIKEIEEIPVEYLYKVLAFDEYENGRSFHWHKTEDVYLVIHPTGFNYKMLQLSWINEYPTKFDNPELEDLFQPLLNNGSDSKMLLLVKNSLIYRVIESLSTCWKHYLNNKQISNSIYNLNPIYFAYAGEGVEGFIAGMLRNLLFIEKTETRDTYIISTLSFDETWFPERLAKREAEVLKNIAVNIYYKDTLLQEVSIVYPFDTTTIATKNIYFINPSSLTNQDFMRLNILSSFIYASGDISCSDALSFGKIPFVAPDKKGGRLYKMMLIELQKFATINPQYQKFIDVWTLASENFVIAGVSKYIKNYQNKPPLEILYNEEWLIFQQQFTEYLRTINVFDDFIINHANKLCVDKVKSG